MCSSDLEQRVTAAVLAEGDTVGFGDTTFRLTGGELQEFDGPGKEGTGAEGTEAYSEVAAGYPEGAGPYAESPGPYADSPAPYAGDGPLEIPYAVRWLVPRGERFANFDILNDNDTQLAYYRKFGHVYAVGVPTTCCSSWPASRNAEEPKLTMSPSDRTASVTGSPLTKVPLRLSRSTRRYPPAS